MTLLRRWFRTFGDVRPDERGPVAVLFTYGLLALASFYVIKPVRNAVFLARSGSEGLPLAYVLTAVAVVGVMIVYSRVVDRVGRRTLFSASLAGLAATLLGFRWLLAVEAGAGPLAAGAFYVFGKLYPLLVISQFWLIANLLFDTGQARRLFGVIGLSPILGSIVGSSAAGWLGERLGTSDLLLLAVGLLAGCAALLPALASDLGGGRQRSGRLTEKVSRSAFRVVAESSHLRTIALILGLTVVVGTLVDFQFNRAVELAIDGEDARTEFFGRFFAGMSAFSVLIQLILTGFVLRRFGLRVALFVLPVVLAVGSVAILLLPALLTTTLTKGAESSLRYSLDQATRELLFLPVPEEDTYRAKPLIDLGVYRGGTGIGGLVLLLLVNGAGLPLRWLSIVTLALIAAWLWAAWRMRAEFGASLRRLIGVRDVRLEELITRRLNAETREEVRQVLTSGDEEEILYALSLVELDPSPTLAGEIASLLDHASEEVRRRAISLLTTLEYGEAAGRVEEALAEDPSLTVRAEAVQYLCSVAATNAADRMDELLDHEDDVEVRLAATGCLLRHGRGETLDRGMKVVEVMTESNDVADRVGAARVLGDLEGVSEPALELFRRLLEDPEAEVRDAAMRAAGDAGAVDFGPLLLDRLADARHRSAAIDGIKALGPRIHDQVLDRICWDGCRPDVQVLLPRTLVPHAEQDAVRRLERLVPKLGAAARYEAVKALNRLRLTRPELSFDAIDEEAIVRMEMEDGHLAEAQRIVLARRENGELGFLLRTLEQRTRDALERALRTVGLTHPTSDLYAAFQALEAPDRPTRQHGFELLDASLPQMYREWFDPLANPDATADQRLAAARERFGVQPGDSDNVLDSLSGCGDPWLVLLARRALGRPLGDVDGDALTQRMRADTLLDTLRPLPNDGEEIMKLVERADVLRRTRLFQEVRTEDLIGVATLMREASFDEDDVLFDEGQPGGTLYVVVEGRIQALKEDRVLFTAEPDDSVGTLSLLDGFLTDYRAVARERTTALALDGEDFRNLLTAREDVTTSVIRYLAGIVRRLNETARETE